MSDYERIARAIAYLAEHQMAQPTLDEVAAQVHVSPFHFQRMFSTWAGTTPKKFLQALTLEQGKRLLDEALPLLDVADAVGLSSSSRLHDHFVQLEAVTPGEYKLKGAGLTIRYGMQDTRFGRCFVAVTPRGVCRVAFLEHEDFDEQLAYLRKTWPKAEFHCDDSVAEATCAMMFGAGEEPRKVLSLHVAGTNFQFAVWQALLRIPPGALVSYTRVAEAVGRPTSTRAVANAIGANPIAWVIPCHRVIQKSGALGGYRWGLSRKQTMQIWEKAQGGRE